MAHEYASWEELKEMRNISGSSQDEALKRAVTRASRAIDRGCGRRFYRDGIVSSRRISAFGRTVREGSSDILLVDDIADADTVTASVGGVEASNLSFTGNEESGRPVTGIARASWYGGDISITAEWGWPEVPEEIEQATLLLANRRYMRKDSPEGTSGWTQEGSVGVSRYDQDIQDLLEPFMRYGFGA